VNQTLSAVGDANGAVDQLAQKFHVDPQTHIETIAQSLLRQPIERAEAVIRTKPVSDLKGAGQAFCGQFSRLTNKFPFNPASSEDVTIDQLNAVLAPNTGSLWTFYNTKLTQYITRQGSSYEANNAGTVKITPAFLNFFRRAAALSDSLYSGGPAPHLLYTLKQTDTTMEQLATKIGGQIFTGSGQQQSFTWTGAPEEVAVTTKGVVVESDSGPWAAFRFFNNGHPEAKGPGIYDLRFVYKQSNGQEVIVNGRRQYWTYQLQFAGANPFSLAYFSNLNCVSEVAH